jgi:type VI secretion system protein ImpK
MNTNVYNASPGKSPTWFHKGLTTLTRMGRGAGPLPVSGKTNPLRAIFTDLIAYVIFFEASCAQRPPSLSELREKILALVNAQEEQAKARGVAAESFREGRFAVLSWVDEVILTSNWPQRTHWQHLMLVYYSTLNAGEEFFRRLERLPSQANDAREIYYLCLSLGFQGRYAFGEDRRELRDLKQTLYKQLCADNGDLRQSYARLFPEAYRKIAGSPAAPPQTRLFWYIGVIAVPLLLFIGYWLMLRHEGNRLIAMIEKPLPAPVAVAWDRCLFDELKRKAIPSEDTPRGVLVTLQSLLFQVNSTELSGPAQRTIDDIVDIVKGCAGDRTIVVEGHASKEKTVDEARNQQLSEGRARTVADAFRASGFKAERISARGFGSRIPVSENETEQGRARNRRVEIIVRK